MIHKEYTSQENKKLKMKPGKVYRGKKDFEKS